MKAQLSQVAEIIEVEYDWMVGWTYLEQYTQNYHIGDFHVDF